MAYPLTCQGALDAIAEGAESAVMGYNGSITDWNNAWVHYVAHEDHEAIKDILFCLTDMRYAMSDIHYGWDPFAPEGAIVWYLENCISAPEPYELTFEKICEAWMADNFQGASLTIAFIDRMRQLIWDEPFNIIWAARPEI